MMVYFQGRNKNLLFQAVGEKKVVKSLTALPKLVLKPVIATLYTADLLSVLEAEFVWKHDTYIFKSTNIYCSIQMNLSS